MEKEEIIEKILEHSDSKKTATQIAKSYLDHLLCPHMQEEEVPEVLQNKIREFIDSCIDRMVEETLNWTRKFYLDNFSKEELEFFLTINSDDRTKKLKKLLMDKSGEHMEIGKRIAQEELKKFEPEFDRLVQKCVEEELEKAGKVAE